MAKKKEQRKYIDTYAAVTDLMRSVFNAERPKGPGYSYYRWYDINTKSAISIFRSFNPFTKEKHTIKVLEKFIKMTECAISIEAGVNGYSLKMIKDGNTTLLSLEKTLPYAVCIGILNYYGHQRPKYEVSI